MNALFAYIRFNCASRFFINALLILCTAICLGFAANQPPVVNAGEDQPEAKTKGFTYLQGDASDDSTPVDSLEIAWTQISGPTQAVIINPEALFTRVSFPQEGTYLFELRAGDGELEAADTTKITVYESLPFIVRAPSGAAPVEIGMPYVIRWRMDPSKPCDILYSLDGGVSYSKLNMDGSVSADSFTWHIDSGYIDSARQGIIRVEEYQNPANYAVDSFVLVEHAPGNDAIAINARFNLRHFAPRMDNRAFIPYASGMFDCRGRMAVRSSKAKRAHAGVCVFKSAHNARYAKHFVLSKYIHINNDKAE